MATSTAGNPFDCDSSRNRCSYEDLKESKTYIRSCISGKYNPKIGIVCGTGLGTLVDMLENKFELPFKDIPNFPVSTVEGHKGQFVFGTCAGVHVLCMQGRIHYYEGYPLWKCVIPIRVMKLLGIEFLIITNAAGGIKPGFCVGDIMVIKDQINLMAFAGNNPLVGPNDDPESFRFLVMNKAYDQDLIREAKEIWGRKNFDGNLLEGVYSAVGGPNFETVAEVKLLALLGIDAIGMSTVHEVMTARHCDMTVFVFSLITNICVRDYEEDNRLSHDTVIGVGETRENSLKEFVEEMVAYIATKRLN